MKKKGFTLVELLVVIVIIGLLMTIAVPGIMNISKRLSSRGQEAVFKNIEKEIGVYAQNNSNYIKGEVEGKLLNNPCKVDNPSINKEYCTCTKTRCSYIYRTTLGELYKNGDIAKAEGECLTGRDENNNCLDDNREVEIYISVNYKTVEVKIKR